MIEKQTSEYLAWVRTAGSHDEWTRRQAEFKAWYNAQTETGKEKAQVALRADRKDIKNELRAIREVAELALKGSIHYDGEEYLLGEWVTIADYARLHNLKLNRVTNWIKREVIPAENVKVFPALNNLRLVRNELGKPGC